MLPARGPRRAAVPYVACATDASGRSGLSVSRLGPRHDDVGPRRPTRTRPATSCATFLDAGGDARRHGARLRRRRRRGDRSARCSASSSPATTSSSAPRPASPAGPASRVVDTSRRALLASSTPRWRRLGTDHVDLWLVHTWSDDGAARGDPVGARLGGDVAGGPATSGSRTTPAGRSARAATCAGAAGCRWWPTRSSTRCSTATSRTRSLPAAAGARARAARLVAAGPRGADRQVPPRHPGRLAGRVAATSRRFVDALPGRRARGRSSTPLATAAEGLDVPAGGGGPGLGARPAGRRRRRSWARAPRPSCAARAGVRAGRAAGPSRCGAGRGLGLSRPRGAAASEPASAPSDSTGRRALGARRRRRRRRRRRSSSRSGRPRRRPRRRSSRSSSSSSVVVVVVLVLVVDLQRGHLAVGVEQGVVVGVERLGDVLVGGEDDRVVLAALGAGGLEVPLEGGHRGGESGTRIGGHATTVAARGTEWLRWSTTSTASWSSRGPCPGRRPPGADRARGVRPLGAVPRAPLRRRRAPGLAAPPDHPGPAHRRDACRADAAQQVARKPPQHPCAETQCVQRHALVDAVEHARRSPGRPAAAAGRSRSR